MPKMTEIAKQQAVDTLEQAFIDGELTHAAAERAGVHPSTVTAWQREDSAISARLASAREVGADALIAEAWRILKETDKDNISVDREKAHHLRWVASKLRPSPAVGVNMGKRDDKGDGGVTVEIIEGLGEPTSEERRSAMES